MLVPTIMNDNWFDDFFRGFHTPSESIDRHHGDAGFGAIMRSDIKESDKDFTIDMDLPGFAKEDVQAQVKDGYLVVKAETKSEDEDKDKEGKYIRRERYQGTCQRSFYVGENVTESDIKARFENGVLKITVPKKEKEIETPKYIAIEG